MNDGVQAARQRLLTVVRSGDWERVPAAADDYGAAVRADERQRALDDASDAVKRLFDSNAPDRSATQWRGECLAAIDALR